jgi:hypothetical protein
MLSKQPIKQVSLARQARINRVIDQLQDMYKEEEMQFLGQDLWLAMQMMCGPDKAALIIKCCQID